MSQLEEEKVEISIDGAILLYREMQKDLRDF